MVIDFHTHNFPDALAPRAIATMLALLDGAVTPVGDGTLARQLADMARDGVDRAVMCPVATKPAQAEVIVARACAIRAGACGEDAAQRIVPFASLHPDDPDFARHLAQVVSAGLKGVKLHPYYQNFALDDPRRVPFFEALRDAGLIVVCHCGFDPGYPQAPIVCGPRQIATLLKRVPGLAPRFVAAHLGGFAGSPPGATDELLETGCWIDTAALAAYQTLPEPCRIIRSWPAARILFGTDYYWTSQRSLLDWVTAHRPDPAEREAIFSGNAQRLLGEA